MVCNSTDDKDAVADCTATTCCDWYGGKEAPICATTEAIPLLGQRPVVVGSSLDGSTQGWSLS